MTHDLQQPVPEPFVPPWKNQSIWQRLWRWFLQKRHWLVLGSLALFSWFLWLQVIRYARFPAHAVQQIHVLNSSTTGFFRTLLVEKGSWVKQGQILATLEEPVLRLDHQIAQQEKKHLEASLVREALNFRLSQLTLQTRLQAFVDEAQTSWLMEQTKQATTQAELKALQAELVWLRKVRTQQLGRSDRLGVLEARKESLVALSRAMPRILQVYRQKQQRALLLSRQHQIFSGKPAQELLAKVLQPLQMRWAIQVLRVQRLELLLQQQTIRSPVAGVVQEILLQPGAYVTSGTPLLRIVRDNVGLIEAYVEEALARQVKLGEKVQIRWRYPETNKSWRWNLSSPVFCAVIVGVGALEPIPLRFRSIPQKPQWVRPVTLRLQRSVALIPGELMSVEFSPEGCKP